MKAKTPATPKARELKAKLEALAERGVNGEAKVAKAKLRRLLNRYDFTAANDGGTDIFSGVFVPARGGAEPVIRFEVDDFDIANSVKWAIEHATGIRCLFRGGQLAAEADPATAARLHEIAATIAGNFSQLWAQFKTAPGVNPADRANFMLGLYDGMMGEVRQGEALPRRATQDKIKRPRKRDLARPAGVALHPYSVAAGLGRQVRFSTAIEEIAGELDQAVKGEIAA